MPLSRLTVICPECSVEFYPLTTEVKRGGGKVCSRKCYYPYLHKQREAKNNNMKMTYTGVHAWIKRKRGMPQICEECGNVNAKAYDWANLSGEYKRDITDWKRLCRKCHMKLDKHFNKRKDTIMQKYGTLDILVRNSKGQYISQEVKNG